MEFNPGDRVICIDDAPHPKGHPSGIKRGEIYTVCELRSEWDGKGFTLEEVAVERPWKGWRQERFRKLDEKRLDVFRNILACAHSSAQRNDDCTVIPASA